MVLIIGASTVLFLSVALLIAYLGYQDGQKPLTEIKHEVYLRCEETECLYHRVPGKLWCKRHAIRNSCKDLDI